jgi:hypothetical protein
MRQHLEAGRSVQGYFKNDGHGDPVESTRMLHEMVEGRKG